MQTLEVVDPACVHQKPLADGARQGDPANVKELHRLVGRGLRCLAARELRPSQLDGCVREVLDRVMRGIRSGDLGNPVRLAQHVRMHLTAYICEIWDKEMPAEDASCLNSGADERGEIMRNVLLELSPDERRSMIRFYVQGHDDRRICRELCMLEAEFRALKARVKARFQELCRQSGVDGCKPAKMHLWLISW
jgi:hypothetical protein